MMDLQVHLVQRLMHVLHMTGRHFDKTVPVS
jgi:hypothetical protein